MAPPRMLVVEDDTSMSQMLVAYFGRKDYQVVPVADGERALRMLNAGDPFDLVLSDIRMPGADGIEVLRSARHRADPPAVVLMTAYASVDNVLDAMQAGAYAYVRKPFMDLDHDLGQVVTRALEERRLRRENEQLLHKLKHATTVLARRQKELRADLEMASRIQQSLLPDELLLLNRLRIATRRFLSESLSGDFYDVITQPDGAVGILLGQAIGRDLPAAILMASIAAHLRELARHHVEPRAVLGAANEAICGILHRGYEHFVSVFYGVLQPDRTRIEYACAGHPAPLHIRFSNPPEPLPRPAGPFLGKYGDARFDTATAPLKRDDRLVFFTEDLPHLVNHRGTTLSTQRIAGWAEELGIGHTGEVADEIASRLRGWDVEGMAGRSGLLMVADLV